MQEFYIAHGLTADLAPTGGSGPALPASLVIAPGHYTYHGVAYDLTQEGLALFYSAPSPLDGGHRIVYGTDIWRFMSACSWLERYGTNDEGNSNATLNALAMQRTIGMRCEPTTDWARALAASVGIQTRKVRFVTAQAPTGFDDGHVGLEAYVNGKWVLFDVNTDMSFLVPATGALASLHDVMSAGVANMTENPLAVDESYPQGNGASNFATEIYAHVKMRTPQQLSVWRQRIYGMAGIEDDASAITYFYLPPGTESRQAYLQSASSAFAVMTEADWAAKYYPASGGGSTNGSVHTISTPDTTSGWGTQCTFIDHTGVLTAGKTVHSIGVNFSAPVSGMKVKIAHENSTSSVDIVVDGAPFNHPGGGWFDCVLPSDFVVPATGTYRVGLMANPPVEPFCSVGQRMRYLGDATGSGVAVGLYTNGTLGLRWTESV